MKKENVKVLILHGFEGHPNGGWRPWLMGELEKQDIYCGSLVMKDPNTPKASEWIKEIDYNVKKFPKDKIILVGHSLGVPTILKYLQTKNPKNILGCVLVSGPYKDDRKGKVAQVLKSFFAGGFKFEQIKKKAKNFVIIHGSNDPMVHFSHAEYLSERLNGKLICVKNGGHLNGSSGF
jgi:predicted alpha/beta hydrolase family esterase